MKRTFIQTLEFSRRWEELGFTDDDLRKLELEIMGDPDKFPIMRGTGGLRKARFASDKKGKSGGARVCFVDFFMEETVFLITVYGKKEKDNLSMKERNDIKKALEILKKNIGGGYHG